MCITGTGYANLQIAQHRYHADAEVPATASHPLKEAETDVALDTSDRHLAQQLNSFLHPANLVVDTIDPAVLAGGNARDRDNAEVVGDRPRYKMSGVDGMEN